MSVLAFPLKIRTCLIAWMGVFLGVACGAVELDLNAAVDAGLLNSQSLADRLITVRQAAQDVLRAGAQYDPELSASAYYTDSELSGAANPAGFPYRIAHGDVAFRKRFSSGTSMELLAETDHVKFSNSPFASQNNQSSLTLGLSQPLLRDSFGTQGKAQVAAAQARYETAWQAYLDERDRIALAIHEVFWTARAAFANYQVSQGALGRFEKLVDLNREREADGLVEETDLLATEAALASQTVSVLADQDRYVRAREELLALIQYPMAQWEEVRLDYAHRPVRRRAGLLLEPWDLYREARANRLDFKALEYRLEESEWNVEAARESLKPELNLFGRFGVGEIGERYRNTYDPAKTAWTVGLEFRRGWSRDAEKSALRQAELEQDRIREQIRQAELDLLLACRISARDLVTLEAQVEAAEIASALHKKKLEIESEKFRQGRSDTQRILDYQDDFELAQG